MNKNILKKLAKLEDNAEVEKALTDFANKIFTEIKKPENEAGIYSQLDLLEAFSYRVPDQVLEIVKFILRNKCQGEFSDKNWINYGTITAKCFELLKSIRYLKTEEVFDLLVSLNSKANKIKETRNETLKSLLQYNFKVLNQIGLAVQKLILDKIVKWGDKEKIKEIETVKIAVKEFLQPSYEGSTMVEWNKLQFTRGSLIGDKNGNLAKIRKESIDLIFEIYYLVDNEKEKFELVKVLDEASRTSDSGTIESLEEIIKENVEHLVEKYKEIVFDGEGKIVCSLPIAMEIERQLLWLKKRWPKEETKNVDNFIAKLKKDEKYFVYRDLVDKTRLDYLENGKIKETKESNILNEVVANKYWLDILTSVADASEIEEYWKFNDFIEFLRNLAEKKPRVGEYLIEYALKNDTSLTKFIGGIILGFRVISRMNLWDKYVLEIEKKKNGDLILEIIKSFIFYFKNTKNPKFREKDFVWIKNIASKKGRYSFLEKDGFDRSDFDYNLLGALMTIWKYKKKEAEDLIISEIDDMDDKWSDQKLDRLEMFVEWGDLDISNWEKNNLNILVEQLIKVKRFDYQGQRLTMKLGKIDFDYALKVIKERLDLSSRPRKSNDYYDAVPMHLDEEFIALIQENKDKFKKEMISWIMKKKPESFKSYKYECGSLLQKLGEIYLDVVRELIKKDTSDAFDKALGIIKSFNGVDLSLAFEAADCVINSGKLKSEEKSNFLKRIHSFMYSTGMVSGEHGISEEHKRKAGEIAKIKEELEKKNKSKKLIKFADKIVESLQDQAERDRVDEDRQIKMMEINFES